MLDKKFFDKGKFKIALKCPTELYYHNKTEFVCRELDTFAEALINGGIQVGELAKSYYPSGRDIGHLSLEENIKRTKEFIQECNGILFESAIVFNNLITKTDILIVDDNNINIIEVKSKSYDCDNDSIIGKRGGILSEWRPYIYDVAFQKFVVQKAFPDFKVHTYLMLVDRAAECPSNELSRKFKLCIDENGGKVVLSGELTEEELKNKILVNVCVDNCCEMVFNERFEIDNNQYDFGGYIEYIVERYFEDKKISKKPSSSCSGCRFRVPDNKIEPGKKNGFKTCWGEYFNLTEEDFKDVLVLDLWDFRKKDELLDRNLVKIKDLELVDIEPKKSKNGSIATDRRMIQINKVKNNDNTHWINKDGLKAEMDNWRFPLHFIDFETSTPAIPLNKGLRPYESIAFQYSHHVVHQNGRIEHKGQYLNVEPGVFPNFEFIRELKKELEKDNGHIMIYSTHESTILNSIYWQLMNSCEVDRRELCEFIEENNRIRGKKENARMVDMLELVKNYYYHPMMGGSNSIKYVLPAIINSSELLMDKYSKAIYGTKELPSYNYENWQWVHIENGKALDPYKLLYSDDENVESIVEGGAATAAYLKMQLSDMNAVEIMRTCEALLRYCELDTMAMVLIYEGWLDLLKL